MKTNEAYKALQHEIANAESEMAAAEDRQLAVMLAAEEGERRVRKAEADLRESEQAVNAERKNILSLHAQKKKQLEAALAERERAIAPVPEEFRILYERIAKRHNGTGVAEARDGQCRGCGMRVLPHIAEQLRRDENEEIFRCESCGLILYTLEPIAPAAASPAPDAENSATSFAILMPTTPKPPRGTSLFPGEPASAPKTAAHTANIDGGSRGNPGPASYGVVIRDAKGEIIAKLKKYIGRATNNVAEYYGLIAALDYAQAHAIRALHIQSDSELLVKQMRGQYKVKSEDLRPLFERAKKMSATFDSFRIEHVYREQNKDADLLANEAMDETSGVKASTENAAGAKSPGNSRRPPRESPPRRSRLHPAPN